MQTECETPRRGFGSSHDFGFLKPRRIAPQDGNWYQKRLVASGILQIVFRGKTVSKRKLARNIFYALNALVASGGTPTIESREIWCRGSPVELVDEGMSGRPGTPLDADFSVSFFGQFCGLRFGLRRVA